MTKNNFVAEVTFKGSLEQQFLKLLQLQENRSCRKVYHPTFLFSPPTFLISPLSVETCIPPLLKPITGKYKILWWYTEIRKTEKRHEKLLHRETGYVQSGNKQKVNGFVSSVINVSKITRFGFFHKLPATFYVELCRLIAK